MDTFTFKLLYICCFGIPWCDRTDENGVSCSNKVCMHMCRESVYVF